VIAGSFGSSESGDFDDESNVLAVKGFAIWRKKRAAQKISNRKILFS
jgi:hypothetical protein